MLCVDNFFTGTRAQHRASARQPALRADAPRRDLPALCRGRRDLQSRLPGLARSLPARPGADDQDLGARRDQHAGPRQAAEGARSCRPRPPRSTATRSSIRRPRTIGATSTRSARAPATTRASAAPRRCSSTITASTAADQGRAHLQHLWPAHASQRRPRGLELHHPGARGRADHHLRRGQADALVLLRRRSDRRADPADGEPGRGDRPDQSRQSGRVHDRRAGRTASSPRSAASRGSSTSRCRPTTRPSASPTSPAPANCSAGSRWCRSTRASTRRSPISRASSAPRVRASAAPCAGASRLRPPRNRRRARWHGLLPPRWPACWCSASTAARSITSIPPISGRP